MRRGLWWCVALASLRCTTPATSLLVSVDSDMPWGPSGVIDRVRVRVVDDGPGGAARPAQELALGRGAGRVAVPFSFGVLPREGASSGTVLVEVTGCRGDCETDAVVDARGRRSDAAPPAVDRARGEHGAHAVEPHRELIRGCGEPDVARPRARLDRSVAELPRGVAAPAANLARAAARA